jgi:putative ABC transport system permease protein
MNGFWLRLRALFQRDALDLDFDDEAAAHLDLATDDFVRQGLPLSEARRRARLAFGSTQAAKDAHREARGVPWLESLAFDARLALRGLRRDRAYALASVAMLALALALNTTVFTVMDAMLFRGYPGVPRSHELVFLQEHDRRGLCCISYADAGDWQTQARSFQGLALIGGRTIALRDAEGRAMDLRVTTVGANLFGLLGVPPVLGRDFTAADAAPGARPVVMLSERLWQARFGGRAGVVGAVVHVDGAPAEIVGIMPPGFEFPMTATDGLWMPIVPTPDLLRRGLTPGGFTAAARLRDGVALAEARAELEAINRQLEAAYPDTNIGLVPTIVDHAQFTSGADARVIWGSLWAAAGLVLLIACANVANLTVVRTVGRWREFVTCLALGAGRRRIVRQILIESVILAGSAVLPAWSLTQWAMAQWATLAASRYQMVDYRVTSGTVTYLAIASVTVAVLLALAPVIRVLQLSAGGTLQHESRGATQSRGTRRLVNALVSGQVALAVVLLAGAGVLVRSFSNIVGAETGVRSPESVLVGLLRLPSETYPIPQARLAFFDRVETALAQVAGIERTSLSGGLPVKFPGGSRQLEIEGLISATDRDAAVFSVTTTSPGYFAVIGAQVVAGRDFTANDDDTTQPVAIVNERFAAQHWPDVSAVGQRLRSVDRDGPGSWRVVVGVVSNIMGADPLRQQFKPLVYVPMRQEPPARTAFFLARAAHSAAPLAPDVRLALQALDANVELDYFGTLESSFAFDRDFMDAEHSELGKYATVAPVFAGMALLLAAAGLVAVIAHSVAQRTREIGVRVAIGAAPRDIRRMVAVEGLRPVMLGVALGIASATAINRMIASQLVGVAPDDPTVLGAVAAMLLVTALAACSVPIRRALRVDPSIALRHE